MVLIVVENTAYKLLRFNFSCLAVVDLILHKYDKKNSDSIRKTYQE